MSPTVRGMSSCCQMFVDRRTRITFRWCRSLVSFRCWFVQTLRGVSIVTCHEESCSISKNQTQLLIFLITPFPEWSSHKHVSLHCLPLDTTHTSCFPSLSARAKHSQQWRHSPMVVHTAVHENKLIENTLSLQQQSFKLYQTTRRYATNTLMSATSGITFKFRLG